MLTQSKTAATWMTPWWHPSTPFCFCQMPTAILRGTSLILRNANSAFLLRRLPDHRANWHVVSPPVGKGPWRCRRDPLPRLSRNGTNPVAAPISGRHNDRLTDCAWQCLVMPAGGRTPPASSIVHPAGASASGEIPQIAGQRGISRDSLHRCVVAPTRTRLHCTQCMQRCND
jgi:hypothetical protein